MPPWGSCLSRRQREAAAAEAHVALPLCGTLQPQRGRFGALPYIVKTAVGVMCAVAPMARGISHLQGSSQGPAWRRALVTEAFCTCAALGMALLQFPGHTAGPSTPHLCSQPSLGQSDAPTATDPHCCCAMSAETLVAKVLAHAPPAPRSSFSVFFSTRLTPITGWAAPVSSPLLE